MKIKILSAPLAPACFSAFFSPIKRLGVKFFALIFFLVCSLMFSSGVFSPALSAPGPGAKLEESEKITQTWDVQITDISEVLTAQVRDENSFFTIKGQVTNTSSHSAEARLQVLVQSRTPVSRSGLEDWITGRTTFYNVPTVISGSLPAIAPGASHDFEFRIPAASLPLISNENWGPRGVAVIAQTPPGRSGPRAAHARSLLVWDPGVSLTPLNVSVVLPISGHLQRSNTLTNLAARPGVNPLVNPDLLLSNTAQLQILKDIVQPGAGEEKPVGPSPKPTLSKLGSQLAKSPQELYLLPWANTDEKLINAKNTAGRTALLQAFNQWQDSGSQTLAQAGISGKKTLVSADLSNISTSQLRQLSQNLKSGAVVAGTDLNFLAPQSFNYVPNAFSRLRYRGYELPVLVGDTALARALDADFSAVVTSHKSFNPLVPALDSPLLARQWVLAQSAVLSRERPNLSRSLVVYLPSGVDEQVLSQTLPALLSSRWVKGVNLSEQLKAKPVTTRTFIPSSSEDSKFNPPDWIAQAPDSSLNSARQKLIDRVGRDLNEFSQVAATLDNPQLLLDPARRIALSALDTWNLFDDSPDSPASQFAALAQAARQAISSQPSSTINLIDSSAKIPLAVRNALALPINVKVELKPSSQLLFAPESVELRIPGGQTKSAHVPVSAIGSNDVRVAVVLSNNAGVRIGSTSDFQVRVRAGWESIGSTVFAAALALLLGFGIIRTLLKRRRERKKMLEGGGENLSANLAANIKTNTKTNTAANISPNMAKNMAKDATKDIAEETVLNVSKRIEKTSLSRASALMFTGTLMSRVLGFVRNWILVLAIGGFGIADAWATANTLPNTIYNLLAGGVLNAILVPAIVRALTKNSSKEGLRQVNALLTLASSLLLVITVVCVAAAYPLVLAFSSQISSQLLPLTVIFALWCLPQILFYGLYALWGQVLNAMSSFGPFMWAPVVNNILGIAGLGVFIYFYGTAEPNDFNVAAWDFSRIALLAGFATAGIALQALVLLWPLYQIGFHLRPVFHFRGIGLRHTTKVAAWAFASIALSTLNYLIIYNIAGAANGVGQREGVFVVSSAIYSYAYMLYMLPQSLVTISITTALFTSMAHRAAQGDLVGLAFDYARALRLTLMLTVLMSVLIGVGGISLANVTVSALDPVQAAAMGLLLAIMALSIPFQSVNTTNYRTFYALEQTSKVFLLSLPLPICTGLAAAFSYLFAPAQQWVFLTIAGDSFGTLAMSLAGVWLLGRAGLKLREQNLVIPLIKLFVAALAAGVAALIFLWLVGFGPEAASWSVSKNFFGGLWRGSVLLLGCSAIYFTVLMVLKYPDLPGTAKFKEKKNSRVAREAS